MPFRSAPSLALLTLGALLVGCAAPAPSVESPASAAAHGEIEGAVELDAAAAGLTAIDPAGRVRHLDLASGDIVEIGRTARPETTHSDGRYVFANTGEGVEIVDSGVWTWDHTDHFHYYRAPARLIGTVAGPGSATVATTLSSTTGSTGVFFDGGEVVALDTAALAAGEIVERFRLEVAAHAGLAVAVGRHVLVTTGADAAAQVVAYDEAGAPVADVAQPCPEPRGTVTTRVGAVIGCADGALIATSISGALSLVHVPYPPDASARADAFANRDGRPVVAGLSGADAIWLLDTRARAWTRVAAPAPLVAVSAIDDDAGRVATLGADGRVRVLDEAGTVHATSPVLAAPAGARLEVAADAVWLVPAAEAGPVIEIDPDTGSIRRSFDDLGSVSAAALTGH